MRTGDLAKQFGVSDTTIRRWVAEFSEFLSDNAQQRHSRQRTFTENDYLVIATIHQLSAQEGLPLDKIKLRLEEGYRVDDLSAGAVGYTDGRLVPATAVETIIDTTKMRVELERITYERDQLLQTIQRLEESRQELETKYEEKLIEKDEQLKTLQDQITLLQRELGRAEGRLEEINRNREHKSDV